MRPSQPCVQLPIKPKQGGKKIARCLPVAFSHCSALLPLSLCCHLLAVSGRPAPAMPGRIWLLEALQDPGTQKKLGATNPFCSSAQAHQLNPGLDMPRTFEAQELAPRVRVAFLISPSL